MKIRLLLAIGLLFHATVAFSPSHIKPQRWVVTMMVRLRSPACHNHRGKDTAVPPLSSLLGVKHGLDAPSLASRQRRRQSLFRKLSRLFISTVLYIAIWLAIWSGGPAISTAQACYSATITTAPCVEIVVAKPEMTTHPSILANRKSMQAASSPVVTSAPHIATAVAKQEQALPKRLSNRKSMQQEIDMLQSRVERLQRQVIELVIYSCLTLLAHLLFPGSVIRYFFLGLLIGSVPA
jgi:hypothetical protein